MTQAYFRQTVDEGIAGSLLKKPAERNFGHTRQSGYFTKGDGFIEIEIQIFKGLFYPAAVVGELLRKVKGRIREDAYVPGTGQVMQDGHQFQHRVKPVFLNQLGKPWSKLPDGFG